MSEVMASTTEAISKAVGSAVLQNMRIVIKELQQQQQPPLQTPTLPPTPIHPTTLQCGNLPPQLHSPFHSSPFEFPSHPFSDTLLSPADSFKYYQETPPYLPSINPAPLPHPMSPPSWVQARLDSQPGLRWCHPSSHLPLQPRSQPPQSPTKHTLKSPYHRLRHKIVPGSVGQVAIYLARESVFGLDVMAKGQLSDDGLKFIKQTIQ